MSSSLSFSPSIFDYTTVRLDSPSVSYFFSRLGVFLESLGGHCPQVGQFVPQDFVFRSVLNELYPLTRCSLVKKCLLSGMVEERAKVRSSELDTGLSSSDNLVGMEVDTAVSVPSLLWVRSHCLLFGILD